MVTARFAVARENRMRAHVSSVEQWHPVWDRRTHHSRCWCSFIQQGEISSCSFRHIPDFHVVSRSLIFSKLLLLFLWRSTDCVTLVPASTCFWLCLLSALVVTSFACEQGLNCWNQIKRNRLQKETCFSIWNWVFWTACSQPFCTFNQFLRDSVSFSSIHLLNNNFILFLWHSVWIVEMSIAFKQQGEIPPEIGVIQFNPKLIKLQNPLSNKHLALVRRVWPNKKQHHWNLVFLLLKTHQANFGVLFQIFHLHNTGNSDRSPKTAWYVLTSVPRWSVSLSPWDLTGLPLQCWMWILGWNSYCTWII